MAGPLHLPNYTLIWCDCASHWYRTFFLSFWCGPFFISFYWICLHFMFWFFGYEACGILAPPPEIEPILPELEGRVLTIGPPGKSHRAFFEGAATRSSKQEERHSPLHHGCHCVTDLPNLGLISACLALLLSSFMAFISYFPRAWDRWHSALLSLTSLQGGAARLLACLPEPERLSSPLRTPQAETSGLGCWNAHVPSIKRKEFRRSSLKTNTHFARLISCCIILFWMSEAGY